MSKIEDGGPAFPTTVHGAQAGMSLRDWFAGQALMGFLSNSSLVSQKWPEYAEGAYKAADAMLEARKPGSET